MRMRDGNGQSTAIHRADYSAPAFWIDTVELCFDLDPAKTRVLNKMTLRRNTDVATQALRLHGEELNLARVLVNGAEWAARLEGGGDAALGAKLIVVAVLDGAKLLVAPHHRRTPPRLSRDRRRHHHRGVQIPLLNRAARDSRLKSRQA